MCKVSFKHSVVLQHVLDTVTFWLQVNLNNSEEVFQLSHIVTLQSLQTVQIILHYKSAVSDGMCWCLNPYQDYGLHLKEDKITRL